MAKLRKCSEIGCSNEVWARGLCNTHYAQWQRERRALGFRAEPLKLDREQRWEYQGRENELVAATTGGDL